jgi:hypothetical protein
LKQPITIENALKCFKIQTKNWQLGIRVFADWLTPSGNSLQTLARISSLAVARSVPDGDHFAIFGRCSLASSDEIIVAFNTALSLLAATDALSGSIVHVVGAQL